MRRDPIVIQPHDPQWAQDFDAQRAALEPVLAGRLVAPVEHIGSTSVPGLPAKPIIDMVAVIDDYAGFASALLELERIGWVHAPEPDDEGQRKWSVLPGRRVPHAPPARRGTRLRLVARLAAVPRLPARSCRRR